MYLPAVSFKNFLIEFCIKCINLVFDGVNTAKLQKSVNFYVPTSLFFAGPVTYINSDQIIVESKTYKYIYYNSGIKDLQIYILQVYNLLEYSISYVKEFKLMYR